ncbi:hypothetical protein ERO13_D10G011901v2 [Gossypium hirsutum]|nr:hypothetical protein ERO13_D10G011901v2 [Gossypium hirsutum]
MHFTSGLIPDWSLLLQEKFSNFSCFFFSSFTRIFFLQLHSSGDVWLPFFSPFPFPFPFPLGCKSVWSRTSSSSSFIQVHCSPRSFFGVEDFLDDDNSKPYTYQKGKKSKNPNKHVSFKQQTKAYMEPFTLDVFISKRFVSASVTHRVTCKQVAVAGTNSKDIKAVLRSRSDIPACLAIGLILAREREKPMCIQLLILPGRGINSKAKSELWFNPSLIMELILKFILIE